MAHLNRIFLSRATKQLCLSAGLNFTCKKKKSSVTDPYCLSRINFLIASEQIKQPLPELFLPANPITSPRRLLT
jgi:hypothetical protein